ncbi:MAG: Tm-1-like ATP-binding domain-containing protein [Desulfobacterales bacterium]
MSPKDIPDLLFGGMFPAHPQRMAVTCRRGIPQVIVPGTTDFILYPGVESVSAEILKRKHVIHNPLHTHVRATYEEMLEVGEFIAKKLLQSSGPAQVLVPNLGFSQLNIEGGPMYDPDADRGFLAGMQKMMDCARAETVLAEEFDLHINDNAFAEILAKRMESLMTGSSQ